MSEIREWRSVLQSAVRYGFPTNTGWASPYQSAATASVRQATVAASTESDHNAAQLIAKELNHMQQLSDKMISARKRLTYIAPDALEKDPLDKKIVNCAHSLEAMAASGQFHDDGSCH
jgi:small-conductance mechanosensitive channel